MAKYVLAIAEFTECVKLLKCALLSPSIIFSIIHEADNIESQTDDFTYIKLVMLLLLF